MIKLRPVVDSDIEWLRKQRNRPELYRYFRQDKPITEVEQRNWWRHLEKEKVRLLIVMLRSRKIGYVGFNPYSRHGRRAEFGMFIIPSYQGKGHGRDALLALLKHGFEDLKLATIFSDVIDYPGEERFEFYRRLGFDRLEHSRIFYQKNGKMVPSVKFFMTAQMWEQKKKVSAALKNLRMEPFGKVAA